MDNQWFRLAHDPDTEKWELSENQTEFSTEQVYFYDGWIWGAEVQATNFGEAVVKAKEMEEAYLRNL